MRSEREGSHRARPDKLTVFDLELGPAMLAHRVAIAHCFHLAGELTLRPSIQLADEKCGARLTLSTVPGHHVDLLVVHHHSSSPARVCKRQGVDLEPMVSHSVKGLTAPRPRRLVSLAADGQDKPVVHQSQRNLKPRTLQRVFVRRLQVLVQMDTIP